MRNYFTFLILIIINTITFPELAYSQKTGSKTFEYWSSGDGFSFKGEIAYVANTYTGPQLRVKINYVEITAFTYKGVKYTNLNFPDSKSIKGTIYFDGNIWYGNFGAQQVDFKNCGITIELSKNTTTANYTQDNGSAYFSEAITENYMDKEDLDRLKSDTKWKETWLQNASLLRIEAVKHDYLSIKNGTGVKEYLIKQIEKEKEKEKFEKLLSSLDPYKQSGKTVSFYDEGIKKIESLKAEFSTTENIEKLNNLTEDINRKRSIAVDKEEVKKKLELEEKIAQRELQKKKIQRLTPDQIQRINQSIIYEKRVSQKISTGMSSDAAHRYVQQESRNETTNKMVESGLNSISNIVTNAIERRAQEKERINEDISIYRQSIVNYNNSLRKINNNFYRALAGDIESLSKTEADIDKLKQEILWIFNSIGDVKYGHEFEFGKFNYNGTVIIEQKIEDVYFEGNILNIKLSQKAKEASYDKSHLSKDKYMRTPQPAKFVLNVTLKYDVEKEETTTYKNCYWPGVAVLTTNNLYLSETDYKNKIKNIDKNLYLKPKGGSWGTINAFNSYDIQLGHSLRNRLELLQKAIKKDKINNPEYFNTIQTQIKNDFELYNEIKRNYNKRYIVKNLNFTNNKNEVCILYLIDDSRYLLLSLPEKEKFQKLLKPSSFSGFNHSNPSVQVKESGINKNFVRSNDFSNIYMYGSGVNEILMTGTQNTSFEKMTKHFLTNNGLQTDFGSFENYSKDIYNPYFEIGTYSKTVDYDYVKDNELLNNLKKDGFTDSKHDYSTKDKDGKINLVFNPIKMGILLTANKKTFVYDKNVKGHYYNGKKQITGDFIHYNASKNNLIYGFRLYSNFLYKTPLSNKSLLKNITINESLNSIFNIWGKFDFLKTTYAFFEKQEADGVYVNSGGTNKFMFTLLDELYQADLSKNSIENGGYTIKYYYSSELAAKGINNTNKQIKEKGVMVNGKKFGLWTYYSEKGVKMAELNFNSNGKQGGKNLFYYENGKIHKEQWYVDVSLSEYIYDENGELKEYIDYVDGIKSGKYEKYFKEYYLQQKYEDGILLPETKKLTRKGVLLEEGQIINGLKEGVWKIYNTTGKVIRSENYKNNIKIN